MLAQFGRVYFDVELTHSRGHVDDTRCGRFADDLLVGAALFWHVDQHITGYPGGAREAIGFVPVGSGGQQACLAGVGRADVGCSRIDTVLGEVALFDAHAALGAGQTAAADALDRHAQLAGGVEKRLAGPRLAAAAGGHEDDVMFAVGRRHVEFHRAKVRHKRGAQTPSRSLRDSSTPGRGYKARERTTAYVVSVSLF